MGGFERVCDICLVVARIFFLVVDSLFDYKLVIRYKFNFLLTFLHFFLDEKTKQKNQERKILPPGTSLLEIRQPLGTLVFISF